MDIEDIINEIRGKFRNNKYKVVYCSECNMTFEVEVNNEIYKIICCDDNSIFFKVDVSGEIYKIDLNGNIIHVHDGFSSLLKTNINDYR